MCEYCEKEKIRVLKYSRVNPKMYINKKFGRVIIIDCYWIKDKKRHRLYVDYKCECGNIKTSSLEHMLEGHILSCGCLKRENLIKRNTKHNLYKNNKRIFDIWNNMLQRCENSKNPNYKNYGGRGISVCKEWHILENFIEWSIKNGYIEKDKQDRSNVLSIERIDVNGNYEPNNCKWIPVREQAWNKRNSKMCGRRLGE